MTGIRSPLFPTYTSFYPNRNLAGYPGGPGGIHPSLELMLWAKWCGRIRIINRRSVTIPRGHPSVSRIDALGRVGGLDTPIDLTHNPPSGKPRHHPFRRVVSRLIKSGAYFRPAIRS